MENPQTKWRFIAGKIIELNGVFSRLATVKYLRVALISGFTSAERSFRRTSSEFPEIPGEWRPNGVPWVDHHC
jgi:hypothetical protein